MSSTIPGLNSSLPAPGVQGTDGAVEGDAQVLAIALRTGAKQAGRKADDETIDAYAGIKKSISQGAVASLKVQIREAQFAADFAKQFSGGQMTSKVAGAKVRAEFTGWCQMNQLQPTDANFAAFSQQMRGQLQAHGVSTQDIDAAFAEAEQNTLGFSNAQMHTPKQRVACRQSSRRCPRRRDRTDTWPRLHFHNAPRCGLPTATSL